MIVMTNVEWLKLPTEEEAVMNRRASATEACFRLLKEGNHTLDLFPSNLINAFEAEAWKERPTPNKAMVHCDSFLEWITAPFPRGLQSSVEIVETILVNAKDQSVAMKAKLLFDEATRRGPGNTRIAEQERNADGTVKAKDRSVSNVNETDSRPTGNSADAGLRTLRKEAEEGNEDAARELAAVVAGTKKVHTACVDAGLRKSTKIDADVKARCSKAIAEWIVSHGGQDDLSPIIADLFACGAKSIAIEIKNLTGEAVMPEKWSRR